MNRFLQTLAAGGALSVLSLVGWTAAADEWADTAEEAPKRIVRPAVRTAPPTRRNPAFEATSPRNYYQELFSGGEAGAKSPKVETRTEDKPKSQVTSNKSAGRKKVTVRPVPQPQNPKEPITDDEWAEWPTGDDASVMKAEFDQEDADESSHRVQQTLIETRQKAPRIPVVPARPRGTATATPLSQSLEPSAPAPVVNYGPLNSSISLEWIKKSELNVGQECALELVVKNVGSSAAEQVAVDAIFQSPVRLTSAKPQPTENRDRLTWSFDTLPPGSEQRITLKLIPSRRGDLGLRGQVRLTGTASASFRVEEPLLKIAMKGPGDVMLGDAVAQMVTISNPGTGAAQDVKIAAKVSPGLEHARGQRDTIEMEIGTLMAGESRTVRLPLTGVKGGVQTVSVTASSSSDVSNVATANMNVISPSLALEADGPALRYKGRNAKFTAKITNDGSVANNNVRVVQTVAEGFQFVSADHGGKFDPNQRTVSWFLGRLEPDQSIQVSCELTATALGDFTQKITVASDGGARAESSLDTQVEGASALSIEIVDLDDPVEVGVETAYEIRVKNNGTKAATNVAVSCELPAGVELLSAKGPADAAAQNHVVIFKPLPQLSPGQESVFRIHLKGVEEGNQRVKARVSSDTISEPLVQEEQTKFYSDERK